MERLRVCLMNDSFPPVIDGVANAVVNYGRVITHELGSAAVVTPFYPQADDSVFDFPVLRYPSVDLTKSVGYRAGIPFSAEVYEHIREGNFDVIHSHCPITSTLLARSLRQRLHVPVVFTYHTKFDVDIANAVRGKFLQNSAAKLLVQNIAACDEVWVVSKGAGENLRKLGYTGRYIVMPNGVDLPRGRVDEALIEQVCRGYDLPADVPVFLFVGRMMWYKGIRITLDALKQLADSGADFRMVFVGGGGDKEEIEAYTAQLGLGSKVFFCPPIQDRDQIRAWYCRADLFLFPSTFDTNGLVVREAAACALASVLVAGSCAAEDVCDGVSGFLIEENAASMAALLGRLLTQPQQMRAVGEGAQRDIYVSWETAVRRAYARYFTVIEDYHRGVRTQSETPSDEICKGMANLMDALSRSRRLTRQMHQAFHDDAMRSYDGFMDRVEGLNQWMDRFL